MPTPGGPRIEQILAVLDEVAGREGLDLLLVERGLVGELEGVEALHEGEAREVGAHGDVLLALGGDLLAEHGVEEVGVGELAGRRVLEQRFEALAAT